MSKTKLEGFDETILEDKRLLSDLESAIISQRLYIKQIEASLKASKKIYNRMLNSRVEIKRDLLKTKRKKTAYPSYCRRYTMEHLGKIIDDLEEQKGEKK